VKLRYIKVVWCQVLSSAVVEMNSLVGEACNLLVCCKIFLDEEVDVGREEKHKWLEVVSR
jgi:hypothetical protein